MKLEKGDIVKTALSENTTVLDVKDNQAILFSGTQFVLATGIKENKESQLEIGRASCRERV